MATKQAKANTATTGNAEIQVPAKLPAIKGMTRKQVAARYLAERSPRKDANGNVVPGLGHVRVMARLNKLAREGAGAVTPVDQLRRFTDPLPAANA